MVCVLCLLGMFCCTIVGKQHGIFLWMADKMSNNSLRVRKRNLSESHKTVGSCQGRSVVVVDVEAQSNVCSLNIPRAHTAVNYFRNL